MSTDLSEIAKRLADSMKAAAPQSACSGEWIQTIEQAAVSSCEGGFSDRAGNYLPSAHDDEIFEAVREAVEEICHAGDGSWNVARIEWRPGHSAVTIDTIFDPQIVPRAPDDPVFERAAAARRNFWDDVGIAAAGYLGGPEKTNDHGQTRWLSPHRRLLKVELGGCITLVTDGLSTPWAGVPDEINGSGVEVLLALPGARPSVEPWIEIMLGVGDMIADDVGIESTVAACAAVLFVDLPSAVAPFSHLVLSIPSDDEQREIPSLPFGSARLLRATAVTLDDLAGHSLDGWAVESARQALARHRERLGAGEGN